MGLLIASTYSCLKSKKPGIPDNIIETLNQSGIYKPGYMKCILTFQSPDDSLKLKALYYLIGNLQTNYSITHTLVDSSDSEIVINIDDFNDLKSLMDYRDSIENSNGILHYKTDSISLDFKNLKAEYIINHINLTWKIYLAGHAMKYKFNNFCDYILPYRVANEVVEDYVSHFQEKYTTLMDSSINIEYAANQINHEINNGFLYDDRLEFNPNYHSIPELEKSKRGKLKDLCIYKIKALRSIGIAATMDYTPIIGSTNLGYYSVTVILPNNEKIYLSGPKKIDLPYGNGNVAKVYRRMFHEVPDCLFAIKDESLHTPSFIGNYSYSDVTSEYISTSDTTISVPDSIDIVYLAIPNDKELVAIDWSLVDTAGNALFKDLGLGLEFTPVIVSNKKLVIVGSSFNL